VISTAPATGSTASVTDPATGEVIGQVPLGTAEDADLAVRAAHRAFSGGAWPRTTASARGALLRRLADLVAERSAQLAETEVRDNGKLYAGREYMDMLHMMQQLGVAPAPATV